MSGVQHNWKRYSSYLLKILVIFFILQYCIYHNGRKMATSVFFQCPAAQACPQFDSPGPASQTETWVCSHLRSCLHSPLLTAGPCAQVCIEIKITHFSLGILSLSHWAHSIDWLLIRTNKYIYFSCVFAIQNVKQKRNKKHKFET